MALATDNDQTHASEKCAAVLLKTHFMPIKSCWRHDVKVHGFLMTTDLNLIPASPGS